MSRIRKFAGALAAATLLPLVTVAGANAETAVALVLPGSIADGGWNQGAYKGLKALEASGDFKISFSENVSQADIPAVVQGYADDGTDLIVGHGYQFGSLFAEISVEYPDQAFFATTSAPGKTEIPENALYVDFRYPDAGAGAGVLAALISGGKAVGMVGGGDNPTTQAMADNFVKSAQTTKTDLKAYSIITGDYNDAAKGREASSTMIGNGADVIWHTADITGIGAIEGAAAGGAKVIGMYSDQTELAPDAIGTSFAANNQGLVEAVGKMVAEESFEGGKTWQPALSFSWVTVYGDAEYNTKLISADDWAKFKEAWAKIDTGKM